MKGFFGLPLPSTEIALIGFVIAVLAAIFGDKILNPPIKKGSKSTSYSPPLPPTMRVGLAILVVLSLELLTYGLIALLLESKNKSPKHSEATQQMVIEYVKRKKCLEGNTVDRSSAQYKIKAVDNLVDIEKLDDGEARIRVVKAEEDLNTLIHQYNLPQCK